MSTYPFWSLSFRVRDDVDPAVVRILSAVASDVEPSPADLATLHPVPRYYLGDWRRMLVGEQEPFVGSPVRLSGDYWEGRWQLSVELSQHDDEFANGGWLFWAWLVDLIAPPDDPRQEVVIGCHGLYRNDSATTLVVVSAAGYDEGNGPVAFEVVRASLADAIEDGGWDDWSDRR